MRALIGRCIDETLHIVALLQVNRILLVYPLATLFDYFESHAERNVVYIRYRNQTVVLRTS